MFKYCVHESTSEYSTNTIYQNPLYAQMILPYAQIDIIRSESISFSFLNSIRQVACIIIIIQEVNFGFCK